MHAARNTQLSALDLRWNPRVIAAGRTPELSEELARMGIDPDAGDFSVASAGADLALALEGLTAAETDVLAQSWGPDGCWTGSRPSNPPSAIRHPPATALLRAPRRLWEERLRRMAADSPAGAAAARCLGETIARYDRRDFEIPVPGGTLALGRRVAVMGIVNVTPDSFSDGGGTPDPARAVERARALREAGSDVIDVGGESTRPGSDPVPVDEELRRVIPVVQVLAREHGIPVSIDTSKARVAREALAAGACWVNDVTALAGDPGMAGAVAAAGVPVVLMHLRGTPKTMQENPRYDHPIAEIAGELRAAVARAEAAGIDREKILVDPGLGFGKRNEDNFEILRRLPELRSLGRPIVVGPSRKRFTGHPFDLPVGERGEGTSAAVAAAVLAGAAMVRVHDVRAAVRVARICEAIRDGVSPA